MQDRMKYGRRGRQVRLALVAATIPVVVALPALAAGAAGPFGSVIHPLTATKDWVAGSCEGANVAADRDAIIDIIDRTCL